MKKLSLIFLLFISLFSLSLKEVKCEEYQAKSYIVMEKESKRILEGNNYYATQSVASISKLMTFYVAYKYADLDSLVIVGEEIKTIVGSAVYLEINETITLYELLVALLLRSGNDAAACIAKYVATSIPKFVILMNKEAKELEMKNTIFNNPHGLDEFDEGNISCAYDMAILLSELINIDKFLEIEKMTSYKSKNHGVWFNKNKLIKQYKYSTSCKSGYTKRAYRTLISSAKKEGLELIVCTIRCSNDFDYHQSLYESNFNKYSSKIIIKKGELKIENYVFNIESNLIYFMKKEDWDKYQVSYELNKENMQVSVYLISSQDKILLKKYKSNEILVKDQSFFKKIIYKVTDFIS